MASNEPPPLLPHVIKPVVTPRKGNKAPLGEMSPNQWRVEIRETKTCADRTGKKYTAFVVRVGFVSGAKWSVEHRYNEFYALNKALSERLKELPELKFPPKLWFNSLAKKTIESRRGGLERFMRALILLQPRPREVNEFLRVAENTMKLEKTSGKVSVADFELLKVVGKGSFGKVFLVRFLRNGKVFAMKVLRKNMVKRRKQVEHTRAERRIMGAISYPFIVKLRYAFQSAKNLYLVTDYCKGGELFFHLKRVRTFSERLTRFYAAELVLAISHLHEQKIVYRDLKPENVLLDETGHIQVTDFGLSKDEVSEPKGAKTFCGTPEYLAPETIRTRLTKEGYGHAVDWWSFGTLVFEMLTGWPPFYDKNIKIMCKKILNAPLVFPEHPKVSKEAQDLIKELLQKDPVKRISVAGIKAHPFFASIDWAKLERKEVTPPFVPLVSGSETDVRYFDQEFTKEKVPVMKNEAPVSDEDFEDFTFLGSEKSSSTISKDKEATSNPWNMTNSMLSSAPES